MNAPAPAISAEVAIVGAGPIGLFLAHLLGQAGIQTVVLERRIEKAAPSMAIGIMPPSLRFFERVGLAAGLVAAGLHVQTAQVHNQQSVLGQLDFTTLPPPFPFILTLPQGELLRFLRTQLSLCPAAQLLYAHEVIGIRHHADGVFLRVRDARTGLVSECSARYVAACDGHASPVRHLLNLACPSKQYAPSFVMGDFPDDAASSNTAHLYFTANGSIESFPLPHGLRRWVALSPSGGKDINTLRQQVETITGVSLPAGAEQWHSFFRPQRQCARSFYRGRVILCGDAAHVMSPIGGQGMNTGFADAWHLAGILRQTLRSGAAMDPLLAGYASARKRAFRIAAARAARGMWLGAHTGRLFSAARSLLIRRVLLRPPLSRHLPAYFAMLTLPPSPTWEFT
jgi:2-polyprenyl-6-methoxyphenol hydroxylase-like FAD-dependent oxidoreductase